MPTKFDLDERLVELAVQLGEHETKREAVNAALAEYVDHRRRVQVLRELGTFDFDDAYDYKRARSVS